MLRGLLGDSALFAPIWQLFAMCLFMYLVVSRINEIMSMTIVNLILQVALGIIIYIGGLFLLKAPIIKQAKSLLKKE